MNRTVRWANERDAEWLAVLNREFNGVEHPADKIRKSLADSKEWVALAIMDEVPVGFACAQWFKSFCYCGIQGEITEMYIREAARRQGMATLLISFLEREFRTHGIKEVKILTGGDNQAAIRTYTGCGYSSKNHRVFQKLLSQ